MPEPEPTKVEPTEGKTFTQDQVNAFMAEEKRKTQAGYADYDAIKAKAAEFDKVTEAAKTEQQKLLDRATAAEQRVTAFEAREQQVKWAEAAVKGSTIPASVLRGNTEDEIKAHFEQLKAIAAPAPVTRRTAVPPGKSDKDEGGSRAVAALRQYRASAQ